MSFKSKSSHDRWVAYRQKMSYLFAPLVSGNLSFLNEKKFEEYLKNGRDKNFHTQLNQLSNENFLKLEEIVNGWFDFQHYFDAFYSERIKRFNRYG
jgi:hypothetical protein